MLELHVQAIVNGVVTIITILVFIHKLALLVVEHFISYFDEWYIGTDGIQTSLVSPKCFKYNISAAGTDDGSGCLLDLVTALSCHIVNGFVMFICLYICCQS